MIKERYKLKNKKPLPVSGKLTTWLNSFQRIHVYHDTNPKNNDCIVRLVDVGLVPLKHNADPQPTNVLSSTPAIVDEDLFLVSSYSDCFDNADEKLPQILGHLTPMKTENDVDSIVDLIIDDWFFVDN